MTVREISVSALISSHLSLFLSFDMTISIFFIFLPEYQLFFHNSILFAKKICTSKVKSKAIPVTGRGHL
jgi:hypothetical protein